MASAMLLLGWGAPLHLRAGPGGDAPPSQWTAMIAGPQTEPILAGYSGPGHAIEVDFTPLGAHRCLGLPLHHLAGAKVHPDPVMGTGWTARVTERLAAAQDWAGRWAIVDDILIRRLAGRPSPPPLMAEAWNLLHARGGRMTLRELTETTGRGSRRIQTLFREHIGFPPQTLSRILRFQRALTVPADRYGSLAELATATGYYDQAHMSRDFRALSGYTPKHLCSIAAQEKAMETSDHHMTFSDFFAHC
ncbi:helix-turn-helix domain-containing protein [Streptomyces sp. NPDC056500]|uniref:helix-turn-helix domain-containing protein n=1 Tax=Streptomyces sp. NPDC056500 TaxID=3345840 RepID=UPI003688971D